MGAMKDRPLQKAADFLQIRHIKSIESNLESEDFFTTGRRVSRVLLAFLCLVLSFFFNSEVVLSMCIVFF